MLKNGRYFCDVCGQEFEDGEGVSVGYSEDEKNGLVAVEYNGDICLDCYCTYKDSYLLKQLEQKPKEYWQMWDDGRPHPVRG